MTNSNNFAANDVDECPKGQCSRVELTLQGGDASTVDCFDRYRKTYMVRRLVINLLQLI